MRQRCELHRNTDMTSVRDRVTDLAFESHGRRWSEGKDVSEQTKKSHDVCRDWQAAVERELGNRCRAEFSISDDRTAQKIDVLDVETMTAYELKASKNNVHMEVYRDVFKVLVFNLRNPSNPIRALVFIAPRAGIDRLGEEFVSDVQKISEKNGLRFTLEGIA